jgi:hypothetical protein
MTSPKFDPRTLSDREEIRDVLVLYAKTLDKRDYGGLRGVFTADATGDYHEAGRHEGRDQLSAFVEGALSQCGPTQHLLGSIDVNVQGDTATAHCYLTAIHVGKKPGYEGKILTVWGSYRDRLVRTAEGWRIKHRELETTHADGDIGMQL